LEVAIEWEICLFTGGSWEKDLTLGKPAEGTVWDKMELEGISINSEESTELLHGTVLDGRNELVMELTSGGRDSSNFNHEVISDSWSIDNFSWLTKRGSKPPCACNKEGKT